MILIDISNHPQSGMARKIKIDKLEIGAAAIQVIGTIQHYDSNGDHIDDFDIVTGMNTVGSFVNSKTGAYVKPIGYTDQGPVFEKGVVAVPEYDILMASQEWQGVRDLLTTVMQNVDNNGGMEKKRG